MTCLYFFLNHFILLYQLLLETFALSTLFTYCQGCHCVSSHNARIWHVSLAGSILHITGTFRILLRHLVPSETC